MHDTANAQFVRIYTFLLKRVLTLPPPKKKQKERKESKQPISFPISYIFS